MSECMFTCVIISFDGGGLKGNHKSYLLIYVRECVCMRMSMIVRVRVCVWCVRGLCMRVIVCFAASMRE